jgi:transcriptional regulator with XRE-family HTH domain
MQSQPPGSPKGARERPPITFGARLRHERERRKISIASIAENTKILGALLEGLENDDVSRWPTGFYRRAFIRAYANSIGLDPEPVVREFGERFPDPEETIAVAAPAPPASLRPSGIARRKVKVTVAAERSAFNTGTVLTELRDRFRAIALDAFVLGIAGLALFLTLDHFWAPTAIAVASYYALSILLLGNTPGVCLFAALKEPSPVPPALATPPQTPLEAS